MNQQIEEPEVVDEIIPASEHQDHLPLKDQFSSDLSEIDFADYADKQEEDKPSHKALPRKNKKKRINKSYRWKHLWVKQANSVQGSAPLWIKKWVKVKYSPGQDEQIQQNGEQEKDKGALELAHAIILEQMNNN